MFGFGTKTDYSELIKQGAIVLDVRSKDEFSGGHIKNSINIPVDQLSNSLSKLKDKNKCIICCCTSGIRSGTAKRILESNGYKAVLLQY
ncbi:rhodanese-like domain-containing protein [Agriterribacter humi]|uniref:rhodanese-like domain-containing protein n=1 Tax=Agriterribacter humi TaxID=1104781 RepID=UPI0012656C92